MACMGKLLAIEDNLTEDRAEELFKLTWWVLTGLDQNAAKVNQPGAIQ